MHKKKYKAIIPGKVKDINAVNSLLIKLRYYWEMVEVHKRHNEKPDEKNAETYRQYYEVYRGIYPALKETYLAMSKL